MTGLRNAGFGHVRPVRLNVVFLLTLVCALLLMYSGAAFAAIVVPLHGPHVGADSQTFEQDPDDGGLADPVVWHFVLNGLDPGTPAAEVTINFVTAGAKSASGNPVGNGSTQHFYIGTSTHDVIASGSALVESEQAGKLVLSHVRVNEPEEPEEPEEPTSTPEPTTTPEPEEPAAEDPFLPFTQADPVDPDLSDPFLPFTGGNGSLLGLAAVALAAGVVLRRYAEVEVRR